jgi:hypothetical protein
MGKLIGQSEYEVEYCANILNITQNGQFFGWSKIRQMLAKQL